MHALGGYSNPSSSSAVGEGRAAPLPEVEDARARAGAVGRSRGAGEGGGCWGGKCAPWKEEEAASGGSRADMLREEENEAPN